MMSQKLFQSSDCMATIWTGLCQRKNKQTVAQKNGVEIDKTTDDLAIQWQKQEIQQACCRGRMSAYVVGVFAFAIFFGVGWGVGGWGVGVTFSGYSRTTHPKRKATG